MKKKLKQLSCNKCDVLNVMLCTLGVRCIELNVMWPFC